MNALEIYCALTVWCLYSTCKMHEYCLGTWHIVRTRWTSQLDTIDLLWSRLIRNNNVRWHKNEIIFEKENTNYLFNCIRTSSWLLRNLIKSINFKNMSFAICVYFFFFLMSFMKKKKSKEFPCHNICLSSSHTFLINYRKL